MSNSRVSSPPFLLLRFRCISYRAYLKDLFLKIPNILSPLAAVFKVIHYSLNNLKEPHVNVCDTAA